MNFFITETSNDQPTNNLNKEYIGLIEMSTIGKAEAFKTRFVRYPYLDRNASPLPRVMDFERERLNVKILRTE